MLHVSRETVGASTAFSARYSRYDALGIESCGTRVKISMSGDLLDSNLSTVIAKRGSDQPKDIVASYDAHRGFNLATAFIPSNLEAWVKVEAFWRVTIMELDDGLDY